jgi:hypothetical protein
MKVVERKDNTNERDSEKNKSLEMLKEEIPNDPKAESKNGTLLVSKKPDGYSSVIKPPLDNAVAAVNVSVA